MGQFFETFFSWEHFTNSLPQVLKGFATNLSLMVVAEVFVLVWGLVGFGMPIAGVPWLSDWSLFQLAVLA